MLLPKPRLRRSIIPSVDERALSWLAGKLGPDERKALRHIAETADLIETGDSTWLLAPVTADLVDTLAAFEADGEDRENDLYDEPQADDEPSLGGSCDADAELDEADDEPDGWLRTRFARDPERRERFRNGGGRRQMNNIKRMCRGDQPRWQEVEVVKYWGRAL